MTKKEMAMEIYIRAVGNEMTKRIHNPSLREMMDRAIGAAHLFQKYYIERSESIVHELDARDADVHVADADEPPFSKPPDDPETDR